MYKITPPSSSVSMKSPIHMEPTPFKKCTKSDDPPQNVDISHLSHPTSTTTNFDETYPLDTSCDHLLHFNPPSHSSDPQHIPSVENVELNLLMSLKNLWKLIGLHQQMSSLNTMTMNCSYYKKRLMHQMAISTIRTLISVKFKMTSSYMPPTLATPLHCPNPWHNTTMKT